MIQRILRIKCDFCGAEGPEVEGEKRVQLRTDAKEFGWVMEPNTGRDWCHSCGSPSPGVNESPLPKKTCQVPGCTANHVDLSASSAHWKSTKKEPHS